jgi:hypothetical protein
MSEQFEVWLLGNLMADNVTNRPRWTIAPYWDAP